MSPPNAERRPREGAAHESAGSTTTPTVSRTTDSAKAMKAHAVVAETPSGEKRRLIYLSKTHADAKAREWAGRGWSVVLVSAVLSPTRIERVSHDAQ